MPPVVLLYCCDQRHLEIDGINQVLEVFHLYNESIIELEEEWLECYANGWDGTLEGSPALNLREFDREEGLRNCRS